MSMQSKSKMDIANNLDKFTFEEVVRAMIMALYRGDPDQANRIFLRLPKKQQAEAWTLQFLIMQKLHLTQSKLLYKANMAMGFYSMLVNVFLLETPDELDHKAYKDNYEAQAKLDEQITKIDSELKGIFRIPEIEEALEGLDESFDTWQLHLCKFMQKRGRWPTNKDELRNYLEQERKENDAT